MKEVREVNCVVKSINEVLPGVFSISFVSGSIFTNAQPGQFVQVEVSGDAFPVTRRPITINRLTEDGFELLFDVVGRGTRTLSCVEPGEVLRVLGPLGHGWQIDKQKSWLLVGGGLGAAGFAFIQDSEESVQIVIGASSADRVVPLQNSTIITEDGSIGSKGLVTDLLTDELVKSVDSIAICGPVAMMEAVWNKIAVDQRHKVQVSSESRMGCGWGVCDGCSIPMASGGYKKCCKEGPVFLGKDIDWKRWKEAGL